MWHVNLCVRFLRFLLFFKLKNMPFFTFLSCGIHFVEHWTNSCNMVTSKLSNHCVTENVAKCLPIQLTYIYIYFLGYAMLYHNL